MARQAASTLVSILRGEDLELAENARQIMLNVKQLPDAASTLFAIMSREEWHATFDRAGYGPFDQFGYFITDSATHITQTTQ